MTEPELIRSPGEVTGAWLRHVLRYANVPGAEQLVGFTARPVGTGQMGNSLRYELTYDGEPDGAPTSLIGKFASADPASRSTGVAMRTYEVEVNFYRHLAGCVAIRIPRCLFAEIDLERGDFVLVLEDMHPCRQGDQLSGCSVDEAALALEELAKLHAPRWNDPELARLPWLNRNTPDGLSLFSQMLPSLLAAFVERYHDRLQAEHIAVAKMLAERLEPWLLNREPPFSIQHGDYRLDNMLFGVDGNPSALTVVDWQTAVWGPPVADASYFLGAGLSAENRRQHERALLRHYLDCLGRCGVSDLDWNRCWKDYRRYAFSGVLMAVGASMMVEQTRRGDEMFLTMLQRHASHVLDVDAVDLLGD